MRTRTLVAAGLVAGAGVLVARRRARRGALGLAAAPPRVRTVLTTDGVPLHVEESGATAARGTVVLVHGFVQSSRLWAGQVRDLTAARPDLRVVAYDARGHGRSGRSPRGGATLDQLGRDLLTVLDECAPDGPVVLVGHSMGGMTLMALAEQHPDLVGPRIVAAGFVATSAGGLRDVTFGLPRPVVGMLRLLGPALREREVRREQAGRRRRLAPGAARLLFGRSPDPRDVRATHRDMLACSAETVAFFAATFDDHDRRAALAVLADLPAVVLVGDRDLNCPVQHSRVIAQALPRSELVVYPGAGHMVHLERRAEVSAQLVALVERAIPARAGAAA